MAFRWDLTGDGWRRSIIRIDRCKRHNYPVKSLKAKQTVVDCWGRGGMISREVASPMIFKQPAPPELCDVGYPVDREKGVLVCLDAATEGSGGEWGIRTQPVTEATSA